TACVDRSVPDAYIRQAVGLVRSNGYVAGDVGHVVVDAGIPPQRELWDQIAKAPRRIADAVGSHERNAAAARPRYCSCQLAGQSGVDDTVGSYNGRRSLASEHRRCEHIGRNDKSKISGGIYV